MKFLYFYNPCPCATSKDSHVTTAESLAVDGCKRGTTQYFGEYISFVLRVK